MNPRPQGLSAEELAAEGGAVLPSKEVLSVPLLDLNVDIDLALALAAPIDLAVAGNLNAALPIDGGVSTNILSLGSQSGAQSTQTALLDQLIRGDATAEGHQDAAIDQTDEWAPDTTTAAAPAAADAMTATAAAPLTGDAQATGAVQTLTDAAPTAATAIAQPAVGTTTEITQPVL